MHTLGRFVTHWPRPTVRLVAATLAAAVWVAAWGTIDTRPAGAEEPISDTITISGRGWGHGRGLGQWGAFGYATGRSGGPWDYRTILAHFYGDTQVGGIANPLAAVTLLGQRGQALTVERLAGVMVEGLPGTSVAVRATLRPDGRYDVQRSTGCVDRPWSIADVVDGPVRLRAPSTTGEASDVLRVCHPDRTSTGYRGELVAMAQSFDGADVGLAQTVNLVRVDDLLRSVLPSEVPPSWGLTDQGRGMQALMAQAVAARGFAAAGDGRWHDLHSGLDASFTTCDSLACQPYLGVEVEDPTTDAAVRSTSGEVRVRGTQVTRTEFTASSGGWTATGAFPAVVDIGDAVDANPQRRWTTLLDRAAIESRYGLGRLLAMDVLERNGLGADGGRVVLLRLVGSTTTVDVSGTQFRTDFGLRSDWFTVSGAPPRPPVTARTIELACPADRVPDAGYLDVLDGSVHDLGVDCVTWWRLATGTGFARFSPARDVTRGQMASFVARFLEATGGPITQDPPDAFIDDDGSVHERSINQLAALGVVQGVTTEQFAPGSPVDRAQAAALVARALEELPVVLPADPTDAFADDTGSIHEPSLNVLAAEGILTGVSAGRVEPQRSIRRDQMASILARALDLVVERTGTSTP
jgi:SpoIID/LytB domain protein